MRSLLQKRDYYVSVTLEEQVYVLGGYGSSSPYTTTEILLADSTTRAGQRRAGGQNWRQAGFTGQAAPKLEETR